MTVSSSLKHKNEVLTEVHPAGVKRTSCVPMLDKIEVETEGHACFARKLLQKAAQAGLKKPLSALQQRRRRSASEARAPSPYNHPCFRKADSIISAHLIDQELPANVHLKSDDAERFLQHYPRLDEPMPDHTYFMCKVKKTPGTPKARPGVSLPKSQLDGILFQRNPGSTVKLSSRRTKYLADESECSTATGSPASSVSSSFSSAASSRCKTPTNAEHIADLVGDRPLHLQGGAAPGAHRARSHSVPSVRCWSK